ncbi:MAG: hypothetical protein ACYC64_12965, partial [Armatimonadota bacterium]
TSGDTQYVVLSNVAGRNSYSDAWKYGTSLFEDSCALLVVNGEPTLKPTVGTSGKTLKDMLTSDVAANYSWVFWGRVGSRTADSFTIDDGSGVSVFVEASCNTIADGDYVSVRGSLDLSTNPPTLTSNLVTRHN